MINTYLYVFLEKEFTREAITKFLDEDRRIDNWFYCLPNSMFVNSSLNAQQLSNLLEQEFGEHRHIITKVNSDRFGRLPKEHWKLFE